MASTWSSVSRLSKSSERHVSPLCDPRRLLLFGRPSDSPCDPGVPCGRSSDRLLLPSRVLFAAQPIPLLGRSPAVSFRVSCSPIRLLRWDVWSGYCFSVGGSSLFLYPVLFLFPIAPLLFSVASPSLDSSSCSSVVFNSESLLAACTEIRVLYCADDGLLL